MAFVINISSFKHDFLRQSCFLNQFEHLISYWSGFSWRSLEILRMLPCSDKFLASSPAPRLYWQWMFARRCCPRRACYTLRKSRRFITWQIYCLPCLSLPSRNLSEWGNSTSSGSRPLFFLKMKKKAATFDISDDTADVCCQLNIDANILCNQTSFLAPTHPQLLNLCKRCFKLKGQACRQLRENLRCKTFFDSREFFNPTIQPLPSLSIRKLGWIH